LIDKEQDGQAVGHLLQDDAVAAVSY